MYCCFLDIHSCRSTSRSTRFLWLAGFILTAVSWSVPTVVFGQSESVQPTGSQAETEPSTEGQDDADPVDLEWLTVRDGGFKVRQFPGPREIFREMPVNEFDDQGKLIDDPETKKHIAMHLYFSQVPDQTIGMSTVYYDLFAEPKSLDEADEILRATVLGTVQGVGGAATESRVIEFDGHPGREVSFEAQRGGKDLQGISRIYLCGGRIYRLNYIATRERFNAEQATGYLDSFRLIDSEEEETTDENSAVANTETDATETDNTEPDDTEPDDTETNGTESENGEAAPPEVENGDGN